MAHTLAREFSENFNRATGEHFLDDVPLLAWCVRYGVSEGVSESPQTVQTRRDSKSMTEFRVASVVSCHRNLNTA